MNKRIVITGIGVITPVGTGNDEFAEALRQGKSGACMIDTFDVSAFSTKIAALVRDFNAENYIDRKKARRMARFTKLGVAAARLAMDNSGINLAAEDLTRIGVVTGTGMGGRDVIEEEEKVLIEKGPRRVSPFLIPMIITNILPGEIAIQYGLTGPNYAVSSACASANHAIGDALRLLR